MTGLGQTTRLIRPTVGQWVMPGLPLGQGLAAVFLFGGLSGQDSVQGRYSATFVGSRTSKPLAGIGECPVLFNLLYYSLPTSFSALLNGSRDWSIAGWFRVNASGMVMGPKGTNNARLIDYNIFAAGKLSLAQENVAIVLSSASTITTGKLYFYAITKNGTAHRLYLNGVLDSSATYTWTADYAGAQNWGSSAVQNGVEVLGPQYVYSRGITAEEVMQLYRNPFGMFGQSLSYWPQAVAAGTFQAAWAGGSNRLISGGVWGG